MTLKFSKDWDEFSKTFSKKTTNKLKNKVDDEVESVLNMLQRKIVKYIENQRFGGPLVDTGKLKKSIVIEIDHIGDKLVAAVGILKSEKYPDGRNVNEIGTYLHEGYIVKLTPEVRKAIFASLDKNKKSKKLSSKNTKKMYKIKGKPFIESPFKSSIKDIEIRIGDKIDNILIKNE